MIPELFASSITAVLYISCQTEEKCFLPEKRKTCIEFKLKLLLNVAIIGYDFCDIPNYQGWGNYYRSSEALGNSFIEDG